MAHNLGTVRVAAATVHYERRVRIVYPDGTCLLVGDNVSTTDACAHAE